MSQVTAACEMKICIPDNMSQASVKRHKKVSKIVSFSSKNNNSFLEHIRAFPDISVISVIWFDDAAVGDSVLAAQRWDFRDPFSKSSLS